MVLQQKRVFWLQENKQNSKYATVWNLFTFYILIFKSQKIYVYLYYFLLILRVFYKFSIVSNSGSTLKTGNENSGCVEQLPFTRFCCCLTSKRIKRNVYLNVYELRYLNHCKSYSIIFTHILLEYIMYSNQATFQMYPRSTV